MSSLLDAVLNSDAPAPTPLSDAGGRTPRGPRSSSARPLGPPSATPGAHSDIDGGFPDDEVVGARVPGRSANGQRADVPKVVDVTGETLSLRFEEFLERSVIDGRRSRLSSG
jgi:DNA replication licensing factor MCM6